MTIRTLIQKTGPMFGISKMKKAMRRTLKVCRMTTTVWVITWERMYSFGLTPDTSDRSSRPSFRSRTRVRAAVAMEAKKASERMNPGAMNSVTVGLAWPRMGLPI